MEVVPEEGVWEANANRYRADRAVEYQAKLPPSLAQANNF